VIRIRDISTRLALLGMTAVLASCVQPSDVGQIVARVEGEGVRMKEFRNEYAGYLLQRGLMDEPGRRRAFLNRLVSQKLLIREARDAGIESTDGYIYHEKTTAEKLLIDLYIQRSYLDTLTVSEAQLEDMFVRVNTEVHARHLVARTREDAERLYERILSGETFQDLATEVFHDPRLSTSGGDLGYFSFDEMDPAFEDAAFGLSDGEISRPVRTSNGFSIIQVEDRRIKPLLTRSEFATKRDKLVSYVRHRKEQSVRRQILSETLEAAAPEIDVEALDTILQTVFSDGLLDGERQMDDLLGRSLLEYSISGTRRVWKVEDFRDAAKLASSAQRTAIQSRSDLTAFIDGLLVRTILTEQARKMGLDREDAFNRALAHELDTWTYAQAYEENVAEMPVSPDTLAYYYQQFKREFVVPARVGVREILVSTRDQADRVTSELKNETFARVASERSIRPGASVTGGDLGMLTREELGVLGSSAFDAPTGSVVGPLEVDDHWVLLKIGDHQPSRIPSLDDISDRLEKLVRQLGEKEMFRARVSELRERYAVELFIDSVDKMTLVTHASS